MGLGRLSLLLEKFPLEKSLTDPAPLNPKIIRASKTKEPTMTNNTIALNF